MSNKKKMVIAGIVLAAAAVIIGGCVWHFTRGKGEDERYATAADALEELSNGFAKVTVTSLGDIEVCMETEDPVGVLVESSAVEVDSDDIDNLVDSYRTGLESTAAAQGITYNSLIEDMGYSEEQDLLDDLYTMYYEFVVERAVVYTAAGQLDIKIQGSDYADKINNYPSVLGYESVEELEAYCDIHTIAIEMLYDKTVAHLEGETW